MKHTSYLYLIRLYNKYESFYKIGISVHKFCRFYQIMNFGYECDIVYMLCANDYLKFLELENYLHNKYSYLIYNPLKKFGGYRECYIGIDENEYIQTLKNIYPINVDIIKNTKISWR